MNCPKCGDEQYPVQVRDGNRLYWTCGSYGIGKVDHQSDLCREREAHNKTKEELKAMTEKYNELLGVTE